MNIIQTWLNRYNPVLIVRRWYWNADFVELASAIVTLAGIALVLLIFVAGILVGRIGRC